MARRKIRKLPARYAGLVMPLVLSLMMTFVVSGVATLRSLGFGDEFLTIWPTAWALSWLISFPTLLLVLPMVRRIVALLVDVPGGPH